MLRRPGWQGWVPLVYFRSPIRRRPSGYRGLLRLQRGLPAEAPEERRRGSRTPTGAGCGSAAPDGPSRDRTHLRGLPGDEPAHDAGRRASRRSAAASTLDRMPTTVWRFRSALSASGRAFRGCQVAPCFHLRRETGPRYLPISGRASAAAKDRNIHVSQLLAGDRSIPGRSPDAARV
jgi:hypothetical protein